MSPSLGEENPDPNDSFERVSLRQWVSVAQINKFKFNPLKIILKHVQLGTQLKRTDIVKRNNSEVGCEDIKLFKTSV